MRLAVLLLLLCACCFDSSGMPLDDAGSEPMADADPLAPDAPPQIVPDADPLAPDAPPQIVPDAAPPPDWVGVYAITYQYLGSCPGGEVNLSFNRLEYMANGTVKTWNSAQTIVPVRTTTGMVTAPNTLHVGELVMATYANGSKDRLEAFDAMGDGVTWTATEVDLIWGTYPGCTEIWHIYGTRVP